MIRGFYTALSDVIAAMDRVSMVADNIANVSTPGFKQMLTGQADFEIELYRSTTGEVLGALGTATITGQPTLDNSSGPLETTGVPTDLAIDGDGLFVVQNGDSIAYTRAGDFIIDAGGLLTTQAGQPVLDASGSRIVLPGGAKALTVGPDGSIKETGQRLGVVGWPSAGVERLGGTLVSFSEPATPAFGTVRQGALERSNVDLADSMSALITFQRAMQMNSRALSIQDETLGEITQLGRLR